jgi:transposase
MRASPTCAPRSGRDVDNLETIPGIGRRAAEIIIAETGPDMAPFATAGPLASWIGVCPGMHEFAGVAKPGRTRPGNSNLKRLLGIAALCVSRATDSYPSVYYRRIAARKGRQRAVVTVMHKPAVTRFS